MLGNGPGPNKAGLTVVMYLYNTGFVTGDLGYDREDLGILRDRGVI